MKSNLDPIVFVGGWTAEREAAVSAMYIEASPQKSQRYSWVWALLVLPFFFIPVLSQVRDVPNSSQMGNGILAGILFGFVWMAFVSKFVGWLQRPRSDGVYDRHLEWLGERDLTVSVDHEGYRQYGKIELTKFGWGFFHSVIERDAGVFLVAGASYYIFLPDDGLPAGVDRPELLRRISAWRKAAQ